MKQLVNVLNLEHLEECLKDRSSIRADKLNDSLKIIEDFKEKYKISNTDVVTSLSLVIYLDQIKGKNFSVALIKATIKDVEYKVSIDTLV